MHQQPADTRANQVTKGVSEMSANYDTQPPQVQLDTLPISPWAGLGVLAAWAAGALLLGGLLLRVRDA